MIKQKNFFMSKNVNRDVTMHTDASPHIVRRVYIIYYYLRTWAIRISSRISFWSSFSTSSSRSPALTS